MRLFYILAGLITVSLVSCSLNNTREDSSLGKYFKENQLEGCFALFDNGTGQFTIYNTNRYRDSAYLPAATFDIVNALIGIETGRVKDSGSVIAGDTTSGKVLPWNQHLTMEKAFTTSDISWFRELAKLIGKDTMQYWIDTLGYARSHKKPSVTDNPDTFWLNNSMKITADEQLGLVKKLYFGQLPFQPRSQRIVKSMMLREDNSNYRLSYKTGRGITANNHTLCWVVGWIEENMHPYFFVLQFESSDPGYNMDTVNVKVLKEILHQYGFMEGKK